MTHTRTWEADGMYGEATFSDDEEYRYDLRRSWGAHREPTRVHTIGFLMLNPSTATERVLDPTIRRCVGFAKDWGYSALIVRNIFALRSTDPKALRIHTNPVGPENDAWIDRLIRRDATMVIAAWGSHGTLYGRDRAVRRALKQHPGVFHLGLTKGDQPKHPLYIPAATKPERLT